MDSLYSHTGQYTWKGFLHDLMTYHHYLRILYFGLPSSSWSWALLSCTKLYISQSSWFPYENILLLLVANAIWPISIKSILLLIWRHRESTRLSLALSHCYRQIVVNDYYWNNGCDQLCTKWETRECNVQTCPINCVLGDYGPWSDCDPCIEKQVCEPHT